MHIPHHKTLCCLLFSISDHLTNSHRKTTGPDPYDLTLEKDNPSETPDGTSEQGDGDASSGETAGKDDEEEYIPPFLNKPNDNSRGLLQVAHNGCAQQ